MPRTGRLVRYALMLALSMAAQRAAADPTATPFDWSGAYVGVHTGGALGLVDVEDPFGASIFGDTVRTPGMIAGAQLGYNWQYGSTVLGLETDASWADMDGTNTCFAFSGFFISANCRAHIDALGTLTGRLGWTLPFDAQTLVYGKAGLAWAHTKVDATTNDWFGTPTTRTEGIRWGWTLGAGAERAVSSHWSLKAEYDFLAFDGDIATPISGFQTTPSPTPMLATVGSSSADVAQDLHQFKIGMNYRFGPGSDAGDDGFMAGLLPPGPTPGPARNEFTAGVRYVHGWGQFHKDLGIQGEGITSLASRLTYDGTSTNGAELYGRLDTVHDMMVKGIVGGLSGGGHMNDEDWGLPSPPFAAFVPYSNTLSDVDDRIRYGIVDVGYDWWRGANYKVAPFVGWSYFQQHMKGYGCRQIANGNSDCVAAIPDECPRHHRVRHLERAARGRGGGCAAGAAPLLERRSRLPSLRELLRHRRSRPADAAFAGGRPRHRRAAGGDVVLCGHRRAECRRGRALLVDVDDQRRGQLRRHRYDRAHALCRRAGASAA